MLRLELGEWRIVLYLNHQDMGGLFSRLAEQSGVSEPASELLIRPAAISKARELSALVTLSKGYWGYCSAFLSQAAPEARGRRGEKEPGVAARQRSVLIRCNDSARYPSRL